MVARIFGNEQGGVKYLLSNPTARVLKGNPGMMGHLIANMPSGTGQRFTAGVLSEIQADLPVEIRRKARAEFEFQLRGGLPPGVIYTLWVEHRDKGRRENHFIIPNIELTTGKRYSPYVDRIDRRRFRAWTESFNLRFDLPDASSRLRVVPDYTRSRLPMGCQKLLMDVWGKIDRKVREGMVTNRDELVVYLRSVGLTVREKTQAGKPLEQMVVFLPGQQPLRLIGSLYFRKDFCPDLLDSTGGKPDSDSIEKRLKELHGIIQQGLEFRAFHTIGHLFGRQAQQGVERGRAVEVLQSLINREMDKLLVTQPAHPIFEEKRLNNTVEIMHFLEANRDHLDQVATILSPRKREAKGNEKVTRLAIPEEEQIVKKATVVDAVTRPFSEAQSPTKEVSSVVKNTPLATPSNNQNDPVPVAQSDSTSAPGNSRKTVIPMESTVTHIRPGSRRIRQPNRPLDGLNMD
jgi:hypothetical protein